MKVQFNVGDRVIIAKADGWEGTRGIFNGRFGHGGEWASVTLDNWFYGGEPFEKTFWMGFLQHEEDGSRVLQGDSSEGR